MQARNEAVEKQRGEGRRGPALTVALAEGGVGRAAGAGEREHAFHVDGHGGVLGAGEGAEAADDGGVGDGGLDLPAAGLGRGLLRAPGGDVAHAVDQARGRRDAVDRRRRGRGGGARARGGGGEREEEARHGGGAGGHGHGWGGARLEWGRSGVEWGTDGVVVVGFGKLVGRGEWTGQEGRRGLAAGLGGLYGESLTAGV